MKNITGQKFNRLTAIKFSHRKGRVYYWEFLCDCGNKITIAKSDILNGHTKSCGCFRKENSSSMHTTHGMTKTRFYNIWQSMIQRCNDSTAISYPRYGGRGIKICRKWLDFQNFKDDMYESYIKHSKKFGEKNTTIDRVNNRDDYKSSNCRWATPFTQSRNKRNNRMITFKGKTQCLTDWAIEYDLQRKTLHNRLYYYGWTIERALTAPPVIGRNQHGLYE